MKIIFVCETELGRCDADRVLGHFGDEAGDWLAFACTTAAGSGPKTILRIEQRCYVRSALCPEDVRSQSWVKPEMTLEPTMSSTEETKEMVQRLHQAYVQRARMELMEQSIVVVPSILCQDP